MKTLIHWHGSSRSITVPHMKYINHHSGGDFRTTLSLSSIPSESRSGIGNTADIPTDRRCERLTRSHLRFVRPMLGDSSQQSQHQARPDTKNNPKQYIAKRIRRQTQRQYGHSDNPNGTQAPSDQGPGPDDIFW